MQEDELAGIALANPGLFQVVAYICRWYHNNQEAILAELAQRGLPEADAWKVIRDKLEPAEKHHHLKVGDLVLDPNNQRCFVAGEVVELTPIESEVLNALMQQSRGDRIAAREELYAQVWGSDSYVTLKALNMHILALRKKIGSGRITTIWGVGYRLEAI